MKHSTVREGTTVRRSDDGETGASVAPLLHDRGIRRTDSVHEDHIIALYEVKAGLRS